MKMEVEITSKECIKPSSPTPLHLKNHPLSLLDQHNTKEYVPIILFYSANQEKSLSHSDINNTLPERLQRLKQSLSETLSRFYPLAGRIKDSDSIDCNDEGIYFEEVVVKSPLKEFLNHPNIFSINIFLPGGGMWRPNPGNHVAGVKVTSFACGGIAFGIYFSHMINDATAFSCFLNSWAAAARKNTEEEEIRPKFDASSFFIYKDEYPGEQCLTPAVSSHLKFGRYMTKRFVFDASAIAKLKAKATSSTLKNPTRVEVVTALFAKRFMATLKAKSKSEKPLLLTHAVNLRRRATPQFSEYHMGNFVWNASVVIKDAGAEFHGLVCQLKEEISKINGDFVNNLQGDGGLRNLVEAIKHEREIYTGVADRISFTSWCNFGFYDLDFGWGKPAWTSIFGFNDFMTFYNAIVFMDTPGNGIEAWVFLLEEYMAMLELDEELLAFATVDPSPLK